tara:strand:+ start:1218 stop:1409 length:192 start_codon:yes stop_codon:yes gene_type:complete
LFREYIKLAFHETDEKNKKCDQLLRDYESTGSAFFNIIAEYAQIMSEIEDKRWTLKELQSSQS